MLSKIKKFLVKILIIMIFTIAIQSITPIYAIENNDVIEQQKASFGIEEFIKNSEKYGGDFFEDINIKDMMNNAIQGKVDNSSIFKKILNLFGNEFTDSLKTTISILVIIIIHAILKSVSESLENDRCSNTYILCAIYYDCNYYYGKFF